MFMNYNRFKGGCLAHGYNETTDSGAKAEHAVIKHNRFRGEDWAQVYQAQRYPGKDWVHVYKV